jgi:hypothetical protein
LENSKEKPTQAMRDVQRCVLACRKTILVIAALKKRRVKTMGHLDRFLLQLLCVEIWTTRSKKDWLPLKKPNLDPGREFVQ